MSGHNTLTTQSRLPDTVGDTKDTEDIRETDDTTYVGYIACFGDIKKGNAHAPWEYVRAVPAEHVNRRARTPEIIQLDGGVQASGEKQVGIARVPPYRVAGPIMRRIDPAGDAEGGAREITEIADADRAVVAAGGELHSSTTGAGGETGEERQRQDEQSRTQSCKFLNAELSAWAIVPTSSSDVHCFDPRQVAHTSSTNGINVVPSPPPQLVGTSSESAR